jgi:hypothetical protein
MVLRLKLIQKMNIIYTDQKSHKSKRQLAKEKAILEEQRAIRVLKTFQPLTPVRSNIIRDDGNKYRELASVKSDAYEVYKRADQVYTGTAIVGISTMHKSNLVPVFSQESAIDIAKMRRG